jgi:hypothetical protein
VEHNNKVEVKSMYLFDTIPWYSMLLWFVVVAGLVLVNEMARRCKGFSLFLYLILPIFLTVAIWPYTADKYPESVTWFNWIKVYSALLACLGFLGIRYLKVLRTKKYLVMFPPIILVLNILMAVIRDFQVFRLNGLVDGVLLMGGPWNIINGISGILNMMTISGWMGIRISKDKFKDFIWQDQVWFWIIAYNIWNFAFVYNCVSDHSYYSGAALLASSIIPTFFIKRWAWLQHRAQTLAVWMMFTMTFPAFVGESMFAVKSSHSEQALWFVSCVSLTANMVIFVYHLYRIVKYKRNPLKEEVYSDLTAINL